MRFLKIIVGISFSFISHQSMAQVSIPIFVDGPSFNFIEKFQTATRIPVPADTILPPINSETIFDFYQNEHTLWAMFDSQAMNLVSSTDTAEHFIARRFLQGDMARPFGGHLVRLSHFSIAGRDPNLLYRVIASQDFSIKNPDQRPNEFQGYSSDLALELLCNESNLSLDRWPRFPRIDIAEWKSDDRPGTWFGNERISLEVDIGPEACPSNNFVVRTRVWGGQDVILGNPRLTILNLR